MATYKVMQDIEAEDKILGPLSLKQFIFSVIAAVGLYLTFLAVTKKAWPVLTISLPMVLFFGLLAWPFGRDQPTEVWLGSRLSFLLRPRTRVWNQDGLQELVKITAPKKQEMRLFDKIDQREVKSRLKALANTLDSRGWAVKNVNVNLNANPGYFDAAADNIDRLMSSATLTQQIPSIDIAAADDIMDADSNPIAQHFDEAIKENTQKSRKRTMELIDTARNDNPAPQRSTTTTTTSATSTFNDLSATPQTAPATDDKIAEETLEEATKRLQAQKSNPHIKVIQTLGQPAKQKASLKNVLPASSQAPGLPKSNPAILELANNNDFSVATLAAQAKRIENELKDNDVISLH